MEGVTSIYENENGFWEIEQHVQQVFIFLIYFPLCCAEGQNIAWKRFITLYIAQYDVTTFTKLRL